MKKMLRAAIAGFVLGVSLVAVSVTTSAGTEATYTQLSNFADEVVDSAHAHVYISEGAPTNAVVVTSVTGTVVRTLSAIGGAAGMVLSPDASTLYVAAADDDAIVAINTTDFSQTRISTGDATCPQQVALVDTTLWYSYGCEAGVIGAVDLVTSQVYPDLMDGLAEAPLLAADQATLPNVLAAAQPASPGEVYLLGVVGGSAPSVTVQASRAMDAQAGVADLALTPDGKGLVVAPSSLDRDTVYSTDDLSPQGTYLSGSPVAVAVRPDGMVAAGSSSVQATDIYVYVPGQKPAWRTYNFGGTGEGSDLVQPRGLAFGPTRLFVVTGSLDGRAQELRVIVPKHLTELTIRANKTTYNYGESVTVTAHLGDTGSNRRVSIYATPMGLARRLVRAGTVDGAGNLVAHLAVTRRTVFTVEFSGDEESAAAEAKVTVLARAKVTDALRRYYGTSGRYRLYHAGEDPLITTTVAPNHAGQCVFFRGEHVVNGKWKDLGASKCFKLNAQSKVGVYYTGQHQVGYHMRFRAEWHGTPMNAASVGPWQYAAFTR